MGEPRRTEQSPDNWPRSSHSAWPCDGPAAAATCPTAPRPWSRGRLVWLAGLRWPIEQCFRDGKQLFGLGDYEGRSWQGWHRPATLVMLAHFFVVRETARLQKTARPDRASDLPVGGRGPAPHRFPNRPRHRHRGLPPDAQRGHPPCPTPPEVLRVPVPTPSSFVALLDSSRSLRMKIH